MDVCLFSWVFQVTSDKYPEEDFLSPSLSLVIAIVLKSILCVISIATPGSESLPKYCF